MVHNALSAFGSRDIDLYREQFHPDYVFLSDAAGATRLTLAEDLASTEALFNDTIWIGVTVHYDVARPSAVDGYRAADGYMQVELSSVTLDIRSLDDRQYNVVSGPQTYVLTNTGSESEPDWKIIAHIGGVDG